MEDKEYNGWKNWETWNLNLHLTNDAGTYDDMREFVKQGKFDGLDKYELAQEFKDHVEEWIYDELEDSPDTLINLLIRDMVGAYLSEVDWLEITEAFLGE